MPVSSSTQLTLDLAAAHEALNSAPQSAPNAQELVRVGGLVVLASEVAAATATDLVAHACLQQQQQQQQQQPSLIPGGSGLRGLGGSGEEMGSGLIDEVGLLDQAAAFLCDEVGDVMEGAGPSKEVPATATGTGRGAARGHSSAARSDKSKSCGDNVGCVVRQLLGLLLGTGGEWGLDQEDGGPSSVSAVAAVVAVGVFGGGDAVGDAGCHNRGVGAGGVPRVAWGQTGLVAAGLPLLLGAVNHGLTSVVVEAVSSAALLPSGAAAALTAASATVSVPANCVCV